MVKIKKSNSKDKQLKRRMQQYVERPAKWKRDIPQKPGKVQYLGRRPISRS